MYIEGIALEHFSAPPQTETSVTPQELTHYAAFHSFFSDNSKHDSATNIAHIKHITELLKKRNIMSNKLITILENKDCCDEH